MLKTNFLKIIATVNKGHIEALVEGRHATRRGVLGVKPHRMSWDNFFALFGEKYGQGWKKYMTAR